MCDSISNDLSSLWLFAALYSAGGLHEAKYRAEKAFASKVNALFCVFLYHFRILLLDYTSKFQNIKCILFISFMSYGTVKRSSRFN